MSRGGTASRYSRRSAARLAAVQALYQMEVSGASAAEALRDQAERQPTPEDDGADSVEADAEFLAGLVRGAAERLEEIDRALVGVLARDWPLERLEAVLRAILRAGAYELIARGKIDAPVTINEYVEIAKAFFSDREPSMVNAVLDKLASTLRQDAAGEDAGNGREKQ